MSNYSKGQSESLNNKKISDFLEELIEISSKTDEKIKLFIEREETFNEKISEILSRQNDILNRLTILESVDFDSLGKKINDVYYDTRNAKRDIKEITGEQEEMGKKISILENSFNNNSFLFSKIFDFALRIGFMVFGGYILWKMGLQSPPN